VRCLILCWWPFFLTIFRAPFFGGLLNIFPLLSLLFLLRVLKLLNVSLFLSLVVLRNSSFSLGRMDGPQLFECTKSDFALVYLVVAKNDTLQHYLFCLVLWSVVDCALGSSAPVCLLSRLALSSPSILSVCRLYVVCSCYHSVSASHFSRFRALCVAGDAIAIEKSLSQIAAAHFVKFSSLPWLGPQRNWPSPFSA